MARKIKFISGASVLITLKGMVTGLFTGLTLAIPYMLGVWFRMQEMMAVGMIIWVLTLIAYLPLWGFYANRLWKWN